MSKKPHTVLEGVPPEDAQTNHLDTIPEEIIRLIMSNMDIRGIYLFTRTNKYLLNLWDIYKRVITEERATNHIALSNEIIKDKNASHLHELVLTYLKTTLNDHFKYWPYIPLAQTQTAVPCVPWEILRTTLKGIPDTNAYVQLLGYAFANGVANSQKKDTDTQVETNVEFNTYRSYRHTMVMIFQFDLKKAEISLCKMEVRFNALEGDYDRGYYAMNINFKIDNPSKHEYYENEVDLRIRPSEARDGWVKEKFSALVLNLVSLMKLNAESTPTLADTIKERWDNGSWDNRNRLETRLCHKNTGSESSLRLQDADAPNYASRELRNIVWDVAAMVRTILQFTETVGDTTKEFATASLPLPADSERDGVTLSRSAKGKAVNFMLATGYPFPSTPDKVVANEDLNGGGASAAKRFRSAASFHDMTLQ